MPLESYNNCLGWIVFWFMPYFGQVCKNQPDVEREAINLFHSFNYRQIHVGLRWEWEENKNNAYPQVRCRYRNSLKLCYITECFRNAVTRSGNSCFTFRQNLNSILYLLETLSVSSFFLPFSVWKNEPKPFWQQQERVHLFLFLDDVFKSFLFNLLPVYMYIYCWGLMYMYRLFKWYKSR